MSFWSSGFSYQLELSAWRRSFWSSNWAFGLKEAVLKLTLFFFMSWAFGLMEVVLKLKLSFRPKGGCFEAHTIFLHELSFRPKGGRFEAQSFLVKRAVQSRETVSRAEKPVQERLSLCSKPRERFGPRRLLREQKSQSKSGCLYAQKSYFRSNFPPSIIIHS